MDLRTQAKRYGYKLLEGRSLGIEHSFKKQPGWFGVFAILFGILKLAVNPMPIFGVISIGCGIAILLLSARDNKRFELKNLDIKRVVSGNNKLVVEYKNGEINKYEAEEVDRLEISYRRGADNLQLGTLAVILSDEKTEKLLIVADSDQSKIEWFLTGIADMLAEKLNNS
ncbi:MAG: hypothetical protein KDC34_07545 [Saprospiraceae bacterium]|nr:hypothetical protein [Saprospiraceae bacterium]